jgi:hypothetical protein
MRGTRLSGDIARRQSPRSAEAEWLMTDVNAKTGMCLAMMQQQQA